MIVFHTSNTPVPQPDVLHSRKYLDFGQGFYVTPTKMQAVNYAQRFTKWGEDAYLNSYEMAVPDTSKFRCKRFDRYDEEWLDYVSACRLGLPVEPFDIIEGGIADDKVYNTIDLYFAHQIAKDEALRRLAAELDACRAMRTPLMKVIHGYGSSGKGGRIRTACRKYLQQAAAEGKIVTVIPGESFSIFDETTRRYLNAFPLLRQDRDLDGENRGVTFVFWQY